MDTSKSQAAPAELVTPTSAQDPGTPAPGSPQPDPQTEAPLTADQVRAIAQQEAIRIAQSQVAKGENRIQKFIQDKFAALDLTRETLGLSDDQVAQARAKIMAEAQASTDATPAPTGQTTPPQTSTDPNVDPAIAYMNTQIQAAFEEVGMIVTRADPEFPALQKAVDDSWNDPKGLSKIVLAASKAAATKVSRLQTSQQTAAGRVVGGGSTTGGQAKAQPTTAHAAWEEAYKKG